jgi:hypothetical protein
MKALIFILIIGFPIALILAWVYELSPRGIKKFSNIEAQTWLSSPTNQQPNGDNKKLAVLPFQNISPGNGSNYFSDGLTEEIIIRLSGIKEL